MDRNLEVHTSLLHYCTFGLAGDTPRATSGELSWAGEKPVLYAVVATLRFDFDSISIRLLFDRATTICHVRL